MLEIKVAASTVCQILNDAGIDPADDRTSTTWSTFLRYQAKAPLACDFLETFTLNGTPVPVRVHRTLQSPNQDPGHHSTPWHGLDDAVLADAGISIVLSGVRGPSDERDHGTLDPEFPPRTPRPHQGITNARPLHELPPPSTDQTSITYLDIRRRQRLDGILNKYHHSLDLHVRYFRQAQHRLINVVR